MPPNNKSLEQALKEAREFDSSRKTFYADEGESDDYADGWITGACDQHAKDEKLFDLLSKVAVTTNEVYKAGLVIGESEGARNLIYDDGLNALAALRSHLAGKKND